MWSPGELIPTPIELIRCPIAVQIAWITTYTAIFASSPRINRNSPVDSIVLSFIGYLQGTLRWSSSRSIRTSHEPVQFSHRCRSIYDFPAFVCISFGNGGRHPRADDRPQIRGRPVRRWRRAKDAHITPDRIFPIHKRSNVGRFCRSLVVHGRITDVLL